MEAIRISKVVEKDGEIKVTGLPFKQGQKIDLILLGESRPKAAHTPRLTSKKLLRSGLVGIWKDRTDITDSASHARRLRDEAQNRADQR